MIRPMRRLEGWMRNIEVIAIGLGVLILAIFYVVARLRG